MEKENKKGFGRSYGLPKIKHTIEEMKLTCRVSKIGNSGHIILPKKLIGEDVFVYYKKEATK